MNESDIAARLQDLDGWQLQGNAIAKEFRFKDFKIAFAFMAGVAAEAERLQHHPDWSNSYNKVAVVLTTHSAGGLSPKDFSLAMAMDELARKTEAS
jgi:4a-hydroxytetrahydrobiopterin dehydratase